MDWILFAISLCVVGFFTGCCCGGATTYCAHCDDPPSDTMEVVLSGLANDDCANCTTLDGTYELTRVAYGSGCRWDYTFPGGSSCGASLLSIVLPDSADGIVEVQLQFLYPVFTNQFITWNASVTYTGTGASWSTDCNFSSLSVPYLNFSGPFAPGCDGTSSTATVSAL